MNVNISGMETLKRIIWSHLYHPLSSWSRNKSEATLTVNIFVFVFFCYFFFFCLTVGKQCQIGMEKLADADVQAAALEDFHSMAELLRQTGIFGLFIKVVLRQGL